MQVGDGRVGDEGAQARLVGGDAQREIAAEAQAHQGQPARPHARYRERVVDDEAADALDVRREQAVVVEAPGVHLAGQGEQQQVVAAFDRRVAVGEIAFLQGAVVAADDEQQAVRGGFPGLQMVGGQAQALVLEPELFAGLAAAAHGERITIPDRHDQAEGDGGSQHEF